MIQPLTRRARWRRLATVVAFAAVVAGGCSSSDPATDTATAGTGPSGTTVRLVTHDSFALPEDVVAAFESASGYRLEILAAGDAVDVVNKSVLSVDRPEGDVLFGIDNNTLTTAYDANLFDPYQSPELASVDSRYQLDPDHRVTPIDHGEVCINTDREYFADKGLPEPATLDDLAKPEYKDLLVVQNPASSTPGLAFMLATVARYGEDGWLDYWKRLKDNGVSVAESWGQAYSNAFSGGSGQGDRPLVVSYASSPPYEMLNAATELTEPPTGVMLDSCYRQIEFAGVLRNAANPAGAKALIDFLLGELVQAAIPLSMYVYPVRSGVALPEAFTSYAPVPTDPLFIAPDQVGANRDRWVTAWTDAVVR
jgi:thiamine transport system substrate-binding protein